MAETKADRENSRTLDKMGEARREALRRNYRRDLALQILEADGEVTTAALDSAMESYAEPTDEMIANMLAAKTLAAIDHEDSQVAAAEEALENSKTRVRKLSDLTDAAKAAVTEAERVLTEARDRAEQARVLANLASAAGVPMLSPIGMPATVQAGTAAATSRATGATTKGGN